MICPFCAFENSEGLNYCGHCGQALFDGIPASQKLEAERKHVTILFSDLSGYTSMSEKLDPEEVKEIMDRIFGGVATPAWTSKKINLP